MQFLNKFQQLANCCDWSWRWMWCPKVSG